MSSSVSAEWNSRFVLGGSRYRCTIPDRNRVGKPIRWARPTIERLRRRDLAPCYQWLQNGLYLIGRPTLRCS